VTVAATAAASTSLSH